jgi:NTE family protein
MKRRIYHLSAAVCICLITLSSAMAQPKVGLVLGGGGAKGGAEVGALKVIERAGIKIDYIAGTSIGAIVGALYAAGYSASQIEALFCQQEWFSLLTDRNEKYSGEPYKTVNGVTYIFGFPVIDLNNSTFGVFRGGRVEQVIDSLLAYHGDCVEFENLKTPFACVAAEMLTASEVVLTTGTVPQAVRASMAIPGIFKPVNINGRKLIDGGMMNNLPVDVVRQMGADIVIAIDVQQEKPKNKKRSESSLLDIADMVGLGGIAGWVMNRPDITKYNENRANADIYVNPALPDYEATNFNNEKMAQMISIGEQVMTQHWNELVDVWEKTHQH